MKVSDVIKNCFVKLGYGVVDVTDAENLTAEQKRLVDILLCSVENVHSEIISAYFPVRCDGKRDARRRET